MPSSNFNLYIHKYFRNKKRPVETGRLNPNKKTDIPWKRYVSILLKTHKPCDL